MDAKTIYKLHALLINNAVPGIRDVTVVFPDGREVSGFVQHIGESPGFVLCQHSVIGDEDPHVTVDPTRVREVRVELANGHVEEFS